MTCIFYKPLCAEAQVDFYASGSQYYRIKGAVLLKNAVIW